MILYDAHINKEEKAVSKRQDDIEKCEFLHVHEDIVSEVKKDMPGKAENAALSELFRVFGDMTRIRILSVVSRHEMCVCDIAALLGMTQSAISHQLRLLKNSKLIKSRRDGKTVFYSLADEHVVSIINCALEHIRE